MKATFLPALFAFVLIISAMQAYAQGNDNAVAEKYKNLPPPSRLKVLEEYNDGKGYMVRVLEYYQGDYKVVQTIRKPIVPRLLTIPINPDTLSKDSIYIVVSKSKFRLDVFYKQRRIRSYAAVFGPKPMEDKCMEGDRCTPEGCFHVKWKNPNSHYHKFMLLDYPNDSSTHKFNELKGCGKLPKTARIGGNVGIHGVWEGGDDLIELGVNWTDGCVAIKNKDVDELYKLTNVGTKVFIRK